MIQNENEPKYNRVIAYIRKSSEDSESGGASKQLNSLESQGDSIDECVKKYELKLLRKPFMDDKSGYEAFQRDDFNKMVEYIQENKGKIDGIVCSELSRLARNFGDGGMILWYLQSGAIKRIYTNNKVFTDSSNDQLMVAIEFAMSKKSSDDTGERTIRGMRTKVKKMRHPARPAILGYKTIGKTGEKKWIIDKKVGSLVREVFEHFAKGDSTLQDITDFAYNIGLRSTFSNSKTRKISKNTWANRLRDEQYTGIFYHEGERIKGAYRPLIDDALYFAVQRVFNMNAHPKSSHMTYAYTGMFACPDCGRKLSGTHKKSHTYYRCDKRAKPCKDKIKATYVREDKLEKQLIKEFKNVEIDQETWLSAREYVEEINKPEITGINKRLLILNENIQNEASYQIKTQRQYQNGDIGKDERDGLLEFSRHKQESLKETYNKIENIKYELDSLMNKFLDDVKNVTKRFESIADENKRELVDIFCENLLWNGEKAQWDWKKPYFILAKQPNKSIVLPG